MFNIGKLLAKTTKERKGFRSIIKTILFLDGDELKNEEKTCIGFACALPCFLGSAHGGAHGFGRIGY